MTSVLLILAGALAAEPFEGHRFYLGDLHVHTGISPDGTSSDVEGCTYPGECGALADLGAISRANGLDFVTITDHVNGRAMDDAGWVRVVSTILEADDPESQFVALVGAEVFFDVVTHGPVGHKSLLLFGDDAAMSSLTLSDVQPSGSDDIHLDTCGDIGSWMASLEGKAGPALLIPHHPALIRPMPTDWSCQDDQWETAVEIYSRHGSSEAPGTPFDPPWSGTNPTGTVEHALATSDLVLGFIGGTDSHDTEPGGVCDRDAEHPAHPYGGGLTVVMLPEEAKFDRQAIYQAIRDRRTYATSGPMVPALLDWTAGTERIGGMGDLAALEEGRDLEGDVRVPARMDASIDKVTLVGPKRSWAFARQAPGSWHIKVNTIEAPEWAYVVIEVDGGMWYGSAGCEDGGADDQERIWLSPTWFERVPAPPVDTGDTDVDSDPPETDLPDTDAPEDTDVIPPIDTDRPPRPEPDPEPADEGCGCASARGAAAPWLVGLLALMRRRQRVAMAQPASL